MVPQPRHKLLRRRCGDDTSVLGLLSKDGSKFRWLTVDGCEILRQLKTVSSIHDIMMWWICYEHLRTSTISYNFNNHIKSHQIMKSPETSSNPRNFDDQLMRMGTMPRYAKGQMPNFQESRWAAQHPRSLGTSWHLRPHFGRSIRNPLRFHIFVLGGTCLRLWKQTEAKNLPRSAPPARPNGRPTVEMIQILYIYILYKASLIAYECTKNI